MATILGPGTALAGTPSPDAPPSSGPARLAPDPAPQAARPAVTAPVHAAPVTIPVAHVEAAVRHARAGLVRAKAKAAKAPPHRHHVAVEETRFVVPRVALPASVGVASKSVRRLEGSDAVLAVLALVAAAAVAGSGARLVSVWHRGAGAA
ncbi:MAG TPA: hypothetical protein VFB17_05735 [Gaiellaceae bacterium]|nr:hypothetical protein [Gaiellaceae bacterium]